MIIELSFALAGGVNFGLEKRYSIIEDIMKKYPHATWKKVVDWKKGIGKYVVKIWFLFGVGGEGLGGWVVVDFYFLKYN